MQVELGTTKESGRKRPRREEVSREAFEESSDHYTVGE